MNSNFYPLGVVTAVPTKTGLRFLHPKTQYDIDSYTTEIWALLAECNGYQTVDVIVKKFKKFDKGLLYDIVDDLQNIGVLIDSREYAQYFHTFTSTPMFYSHNLSFDEIAVYSRRPRLPVFKGTTYALPRTSTGLTDIMAARKSCRSFSKVQLSPKELGRVLLSSYIPDGPATPSAGGLYPLKIYVLITQPGLMPRGYYEYDPAHQTLNLFNVEFDQQILEFAFNSDSLLYGAATIVVIAADLKRHLGKYSNRGYRYTLLEAGHAAQNIQLSSTEEGLGCLEYGGFQDNILAEELGLDKAGVTPLITLALGHKAETPSDDSQTLLMHLEKELVGPNKPVRYVRITGGNQPSTGDSFFAATALHKPNAQQDARHSYGQRFVGGTGTSSNLAEVKAIAEAYERYASGLVRIDECRPATDIRDRWLDPRKIAPLTEDQMRDNALLQPFVETSEQEWVLGKSLRDNTPVYVPIDLVFYPLFAANLGRKPLHEGNSSGVAAFSSMHEAEKRALLELIERDSLMRTWLIRVPPKQLAQETLPFHWRRRVEYWKSRGRDVHVFDISNHGVIVTSVVIVSEETYPLFVSGASASAKSFDESVAKAFHEAELVLLHMLKAPRSRKIDPRHVYHPMDHARLYAHPDHLDNLRWLWSGEETTLVPTVRTTFEQLYGELDAVAVRLSPQDAVLSVARVLSEKLVPINFGHGTEYHSHPTLSGRVHPDSLKLPHFFA